MPKYYNYAKGEGIMRKRFYEKTVACLFSMLLTVANVVPVGAEGIELDDQAKPYSVEQAADYDETEVPEYPIWNNQAGILGDLTGDGEVTLQDAKAVLQLALGLNSISEEQKKVIDINGDGIINLQDVQFVLKGALKVIPSLEEYYNIHQVVRYFEENIEPDEEGDYYLVTDMLIGSTSEEFLIIYHSKENCFEFVRMTVREHINKVEYLTVYFKYDIFSLSAVNHKIYFSGFSPSTYYEYNEEAEADFNTGIYKIQDLPYEITTLEGVPWQSTFDHANDTTKLAFSYWNEILYKACKIKLNNIGFRSFQKH